MKHDPIRYEPERVRQVIERLGTLVDPIALMSRIAQKTRNGKQPGPTPWHYTEDYVTEYGRADEHVRQIADAFALVGVSSETDAAVWIAEHEDKIP